MPKELFGANQEESEQEPCAKTQAKSLAQSHKTQKHEKYSDYFDHGFPPPYMHWLVAHRLRLIPC